MRSRDVINIVKLHFEVVENLGDSTHLTPSSTIGELVQD
jgi:hypothetical protein